jgi:VWFA-related protein
VIKISSNVVKITAKKVLLVTMLWGVPMLLNAQAPEGPMTPDPTVVPQKVPNIKVRTVLVNTPVTVRNPQGEMVHSLEATDFKITDNGVPQKITHFNMGGDPISLVVVVETSSRIGPILAQIRKTGILISQTVIGPTGEGAVVTFDDDVKTPLDFTNFRNRLWQAARDAGDRRSARFRQ